MGSQVPLEGVKPAIRVLVVDDSAYMRFTIGRGLSQSPDLRVVGAARDGREALRLIPELQPDVVTLDVEMPQLDGLSTLREIMVRFPRPVVMLSSLTSRGARETVQALTLGAVDFAAKPVAKANVAAIMDEVIEKVRAAAQARVAPGLGAGGSHPASDNAERRRPASEGPTTARLKSIRPLAGQDRVVVIGASTGGPRALNTLIPALPPDLPAAVLIVQHMPAGFTRTLAERLETVSALAIKEAEAGDAVEVGRCLLAPGGFHMALDGRSQIALNKNPAVHGVRPAVDVTMTSVAERHGPAAVGVILTGMGRDGAHGAALIRAAGGRVIAEDESTCVVWGMPRSVVEAGAADTVVALPGIAEAIRRAVEA